MATRNSDIELPPIRGIDPLHPLLDAFVGNAEQLENWHWNMGGGVYLAVLDGDAGTVQVGVMRNPHAWFRLARRSPWWSHVTHAVVYRIDCRWHERPQCSVVELDRAARHLKGWLVETFTPSALTSGPIG